MSIASSRISPEQNISDPPGYLERSTTWVARKIGLIQKENYTSSPSPEKPLSSQNELIEKLTQKKIDSFELLKHFDQIVTPSQKIKIYEYFGKNRPHDWLDQVWDWIHPDPQRIHELDSKYGQFRILKNPQCLTRILLSILQRQ